MSGDPIGGKWRTFQISPPVTRSIDHQFVCSGVERPNKLWRCHGKRNDDSVDDGDSDDYDGSDDWRKKTVMGGR